MTISTPNPGDTGPLALGFIGGALRSAVGYTHFIASRMDNRWSVDAGCFSTHNASNRETAGAYGVAAERTYGDWRAMLQAERQRLDAMLILTPTPAHAEMVIACLEAGIPVICEKALATSSHEAHRIMEARNARQGFLAVTYNYTGYPMLRELRHRILTGTLGKILHFQAEMPQEGFSRLDAQGNKPSPQTWRLHDGEIPTLYLDLGVHLHQIIHYLTGESPIEVAADQASYGWFSNVVDNACCLARYSGGLRGQFWFGKSSLGQRNGLRIRIFGSEASAEWHQVHPEELVLAHIDGRREVLDRGDSAASIASETRYTRFKAGHPSGFVEAFANLYCDLADCLITYKDQRSWSSGEVFGADLAVEGLCFLEAMAASAHTGKWRKVIADPAFV